MIHGVADDLIVPVDGVTRDGLPRREWRRLGRCSATAGPIRADERQERLLLA